MFHLFYARIRPGTLHNHESFVKQISYIWAEAKHAVITIHPFRMKTLHFCSYIFITCLVAVLLSSCENTSTSHSRIIENLSRYDIRVTHTTTSGASTVQKSIPTNTSYTFSSIRSTDAPETFADCEPSNPENISFQVEGIDSLSVTLDAEIVSLWVFTETDGGSECRLTIRDGDVQ